MNMSILAIILQVVFGLACAGFGVYFCATGGTANAIIFFVVGVACVVNAVRLYIVYRKNKNNKDE